MKTFTLILAVPLFITASVFAAGMPIIDVANLEQQLQNQMTNIVQYSQTATQTLQSAKKLEAQVLQLGNFQSIMNLPGLGTIKQGIGVFNKAKNSINQLSNLNPGSFTNQFSSLANSYSSGFGNLLNSSYSAGTTYTMPMDTAIAKAVNTFQQDFNTLDSQRQNLEQQIANLTQQLNGASTAAEVSKLNAQIAAVNGQLNSTNQRIIQSADTSRQAAQQATAAQDTIRQAAGAVEGDQLQQSANTIFSGSYFSADPTYFNQ